MRDFIICFSLAILFLSCSEGKKVTEDDKPELLDVPSSLVAFNIDFTQDELEAGINNVLPRQIFKGRVAMKKEKDTLLLKIERRGDLKTSIRNDNIFVSVPLHIEVAIKKKLFGVTVSNEDSPISFEGILKASTQIALLDDWDLDVSCMFEDFDLEGSPTFNILGFSFQIEKNINKALEDNSDEISDTICRALAQAFDFQQLLGNVYSQLQKGQQIVRGANPLWLYVEPNALSGKLIPKSKDTLSLYLEFRTNLQVSPENRTDIRPRLLEAKGTPLNTASTIVAYPEVRIELSRIGELFKDNILHREFSYKEYKIQFTEAKVSRYGQLIQLNLTSDGDITGEFVVRGIPSLNKDGVLTLEEFSYRIDADEEWVEMAEWAIHDVIESYILDEMTFDASRQLDNLDSLIVASIEKLPISSKMALNLDFKTLDSHAIRVTDEYLQWIFYLEGKGGLQLKRGIFKPKR